MTTSIVTLLPDTPVSAVARILAKRGISGAPVVNAEGQLLGLVTESDLIRRLAALEDRPRGWIRGLFALPSEQAARYARTHGRLARDVMTTDLVTVEEDAPIERVASLLELHRIRRVPVQHEGLLVGVVSRADLLGALLAPPAEGAATEIPDGRVRRELLARMRAQPLVDPYFVFAEVEGGVVTIHGFCRTEEVRRALRVLAEGVPGVKEIRLDLAPTPPFVLAAA
jgi:CBS domain-containing protein